MFLAQINLTDIDKLNELPGSGLLQFYVANDDMFGNAPNDYLGFDHDDFLLLQLDIEDECGILCLAMPENVFSQYLYDWQCC